MPAHLSAGMEMPADTRPPCKPANELAGDARTSLTGRIPVGFSRFPPMNWRAMRGRPLRDEFRWDFRVPADKSAGYTGASLTGRGAKKCSIRFCPVGTSAHSPPIYWRNEMSAHLWAE